MGEFATVLSTQQYQKSINRPVITGIGAVSSLGEDLRSSWRRLLAGKTGVTCQQPFADLPPFPLALLGNRPTNVPTLLEKTVRAAIADAQLSVPLPDCAVVIGSSRSQQSRLEELAHRYYQSSPPVATDFLDNWLPAFPAETSMAAARQIGSQTAVRSPMAACATGLWAIAQACELIATGTSEQAIAGAVEAPITPLTLAGFRRMGALATTGCYPFDRHREGFVLAEAGAVFVLETPARAQKRQVPAYAQVLGTGFSADAYHISAPTSTPESAILAVKQCLAASHLNPEDIDYIHAHGTGTSIGDAREATLIQNLFPETVLVSATKGATGHPLGASGAVGAAFSLLALQQQTVPPCVGLQQPEFPQIHWVQKSQPAPLNQVLNFSFGFGGQNAVVALGKSPF
jgi:3-oxoacyl-[acyl-carrier-protein] synthase II